MNDNIMWNYQPHYVLAYDIGSNSEARKVISEFIDKNKGVELSLSCYLVRTSESISTFIESVFETLTSDNKLSLIPIPQPSEGLSFEIWGQKVMDEIKEKQGHLLAYISPRKRE